MSELREILTTTVERLLESEVSKTLLEQAQRGEWPAALWEALETNGLTQPLIPQAAGGVGASWEDVFAIVYHCGRWRAPVPLPETALAGWLLASAGIEPPPGALGVIPDASGLALVASGNGWLLQGRAGDVPWGRHVSHLAAVVEHEGRARLVLVEAKAGTLAPAANMAGEPRDTLTFEGSPAAAAAELPGPLVAEVDAVRQGGALLRSAQIAGASGWVLDQTLRYASERVQFGRPLAKIQAIQHYLATLASRVAQATIGAESAFRAVDRASGLADAELDIAAAKVVVGDAAWAAASLGHQVHGAIGFTHEHGLHYATRRLWCWRSEFGAEGFWAERLGRAALERGPQALWPDLTARQARRAAED